MIDISKLTFNQLEEIYNVLTPAEAVAFKHLFLDASVIRKLVRQYPEDCSSIYSKVLSFCKSKEKFLKLEGLRLSGDYDLWESHMNNVDEDFSMQARLFVEIYDKINNLFKDGGSKDA